MIAAAAALFGSELVIGGRAYVVRPPSVLTALAVTAAVEHDANLLPEACAGPDARGRPWMPPSMRSVLFSRSVRPAERRRVVLTAMLAGVPDEQLERAARQQAEAGAEAARDGWEAVLSRYQATYAPADVLALPWPFFLAMSDEIRRERARAALDWAAGYAAVRSTDRKAWDGLVREAGYGVGGIAYDPAGSDTASGRGGPTASGRGSVGSPCDPPWEGHPGGKAGWWADKQAEIRRTRGFLRQETGEA